MGTIDANKWLMIAQAKTPDDIFIVDDDPAVREILSLALSLAGYRVVAFADGSAFLKAARKHTPACIILDVRMPDCSGIELLKELNAEQYGAPILIISAHGDIAMAIDAIRSGALDFIEKPFDADTVVGRVRTALDAAARSAERTAGEAPSKRFPGRDLLTKRESEVLEEVVAGASNREAGAHLGISPRTIEVHRARIMEKLGARNLADLVRIVMSNGQR